jgi:hypothetical protein
MTRRRITRRGRRNFTLDELLRERGEIRGANERTASNPEEVGVSDIDGLTHKDIHEARIIRDAEMAEPQTTIALKRGDEKLH